MYDTNIQKLYLGVMLSDGDLLTKVKSITKPNLFSRELQKVVSEVLSYVDEYDGIPDPTYIETKTNVEIKVPNKIDDSIRDWFYDEYPKFCLHKALEEAVIKSTELIESEDYDGVEQLIKQAQETRLVKDYGLDYSDNPKERLQAIKDRSGNISTGFESLDDVVGKINIGDLVIYAGGPGSGKSLFLQNNSLHHYSVEGKNVMYITLELSPDLCAQRIDSMLLEQPTKRLYENLDATDKAIRKKTQEFEKHHNGGMIKIKYMPSGSTTSDIKSFVKDFMVTTGNKVDVLVVDYLDLVNPAQKVQLGDVFQKDKAVSEELRNMSQELEMVSITASQLNRSSVGQDDLDHSHIAGGISKINTADLVLGIIITDAMREKGYYELQALKVRNNNGTGRRVRLGYKESCMKIHDDEDHLINNNSDGKSLSETEVLFNEIQNELNTDNESYNPIDIETGKVKPSQDLIETDKNGNNTINVPKEMRTGLGNDKADRLRSMLRDDDDDV
ncbi:DNA primase-helicase subunit [Salicola phage SCTP-2]|nr:DNA primase-helicase subunit [Salicola phage SCTP-2]